MGIRPACLLSATPPLLLYAALNCDLLAVFFLLLALLLFQRGKDGWGALCLSLGIWTELFPALFLPWVALQRAVERGEVRAGRGGTPDPGQQSDQPPV